MGITTVELKTIVSSGCLQFVAFGVSKHVSVCRANLCPLEALELQAKGLCVIRAVVRDIKLGGGGQALNFPTELGFWAWLFTITHTHTSCSEAEFPLHRETFRFLPSSTVSHDRVLKYDTREANLFP